MFNDYLQDLLGRKFDQPKVPQVRIYSGQGRPKQLQVEQAQGMQQGGQWEEDSYTPAAALEKTGYINPQTTQYSGLQQGGISPQQTNDPYSQLRRLLRF